MAELTKNLKHTRDQYENKLKIMKTEIETLDTAVKEMKQKIEEYHNMNKKNN